MSGTPIENEPRDLVGYLKMLSKNFCPNLNTVLSSCTPAIVTDWAAKYDKAMLNGDSKNFD